MRKPKNKMVKWSAVAMILLVSFIAIGYLSTFFKTDEVTPVTTPTVSPPQASGGISWIIGVIVIIVVLAGFIYFITHSEASPKSIDENKFIKNGFEHLLKNGRMFYSTSARELTSDITKFAENTVYTQYNYLAYWGKNYKFPILMVAYSMLPLKEVNRFNRTTRATYTLMILPRKNHIQILPENMCFDVTMKYVNDLYYGRIGLPPVPSSVESPIPHALQKEYADAYAKAKGEKEGGSS